MRLVSRVDRAGGCVSALLKMAFHIFPCEGAARAFSAIDLTVRMPVAIGNPYRLMHHLTARGLIVLAFSQGGQKFYWRAKNALPPEDAPRGVDSHKRINRHLRAARAIKMAKRGRE